MREILPCAIRGGGVDVDFQKIIGHIVKCVGLGITDPKPSAESAYNTSKASSGEVVDSLLGGTALNYVGHKACVHRASAGAIKEWKHMEMVDLARQKELEVVQ